MSDGHHQIPGWRCLSCGHFWSHIGGELRACEFCGSRSLRTASGPHPFFIVDEAAPLPPVVWKELMAEATENLEARRALTRAAWLQFLPRGQSPIVPWALTEESAAVLRSLGIKPD